MGEELSPIDEMLEYFAYDHLPEKLQAVSKPYHELAHELADSEELVEKTLMIQ